MGVRKVAKGSGFLIFFSRLDIITPIACAQITFCGIKSDSKLPVKSDRSQMEGGVEGGGNEKRDLLSYI